MLKAGCAALLVGSTPALAQDAMSLAELTNLIANTLYEEPCSNVLFPDADTDLETMTDADVARLLILQTFTTGASIGQGSSDIDVAIQLGQACYATPDTPLAELTFP